jgi:type IV secretory pathway ATPase VirB11/archaellum biosynthesis ATPase
VDEYSVKDASVQIFKHPFKVQHMYVLNTPEYTLPPDKYFILSKAREVVAQYRPGKASLSTVAKSRKYFERVYQSTIRDLSKKYNIALQPEDIEDLSRVVARYTVGYGILEILLSDRRVTDIYLDSPIGQKPIYIVHSDFGQCETNILYTEEEAEGMASKLRAMSGRPFDEAHPVLDFDLPDMDTRAAVIGPPLAPDGTAFAFRLHKVTPWTLPQFIDAKMLTPLSAGLLTFFIQNQATMLVCGSRGAGKTSLLGSLLLEILQNSRVLVQEDTLEIPVPYMKGIGFNIQRMKTRSPISVASTEAEVAPEQALRTALRLGDSALILGEVRSTEAKVLYEAMRVGAAGNVVMGTIHADSAYAVWDRVVNDLGVPSTSFKATDLVVVARPVRFGGSLRRHRRVVQVTEVKKHWLHDPDAEGGLLDLMSYDAKDDNLELLEDNLKESALFEKISRLSGLNYKDMWNQIRMHANAKEFLVDMKNEFKIPKLLEAENTVFANNKLILLKEDQLNESGSLDVPSLLGEWKNWVKTHLVKKMVKELPKAAAKKKKKK